VDAVRQEIPASDDLRSTAEYRREMAALLLQRAIRQITES
jgi:CO/xanthine dehydrogenase FAD-binding subunit